MEPKEAKHSKRTQRDYPHGFKLQVVAEVERGESTYKQAQRKYGIQGRSTVLTWLRKFGTMDWTTPKGYAPVPMRKAKELTPQQQIKRLQAQLQEERDRTLAWKTMVEVAEEELGIPIRKKFGPKQSAASKPRTDGR